MNRLLNILFVFSLLAGSVVSAQEIKVRIQTKDTKTYVGSVSERSSGSVVFRSTGGEAVRFTDDQISLIRFDVSEGQEAGFKRLSDDGKYSELATVLSEFLLPFLPYVDLPSNLTPMFESWMAASYWAGDYDRVESLSVALEKFYESARFYRMLAVLAKGGYQSMENFLTTPQADKIFPPESAARLYIEARLAQNTGNYNSAIRSAARLMALHSRNGDWMPQAELLCLELYVQLNKPESVQAVLTDIQAFYMDPQIQKKAAAIAAVK